MTYQGHIKNGQITLDQPVQLPEGAIVNIQVVEAKPRITRPANRQPLESADEERRKHRRTNFQPIELPGGPLSDDIIRDRR